VRLIDWLSGEIDSRAPLAAKISNWKIEKMENRGEPAFSPVSLGALVDWKKKVENDFGGAAPSLSTSKNWQVNNQTQQPNEHFDSSNIFKEIQRDTYYRTFKSNIQIEHQIEHPEQKKFESEYRTNWYRTNKFENSEQARTSSRANKKERTQL